LLRRLFGVEDAHLSGQPLDDATIVFLAEIGGECIDDRVADLVERIHVLARFLVAVGNLQAGIVKRIPGAVAAGERARRGLADMADTERIDEAFERNLAPRRDGAEQIADGNVAVAFDLLELELRVARLQGEDVGRLLEPALVEEESDLLLAKPV